MSSSPFLTVKENNTSSSIVAAKEFTDEKPDDALE